MNKLKKEKKICLDETIVKKLKLKHSSSSQFLFKYFPKLFSECAMFIGDRRNTNLTKNIMMAALVTMNSALEIYIYKLRCNSLYYFVDNKKITWNYYPFPQLCSFLFIICLVILIFLCFLFIRMFLNFHSCLLSCSPHISHLHHFQ